MNLSYMHCVGSGSFFTLNAISLVITLDVRQFLGSWLGRKRLLSNRSRNKRMWHRIVHRWRLGENQERKQEIRCQQRHGKVNNLTTGDAEDRVSTSSEIPGATTGESCETLIDLIKARGKWRWRNFIGGKCRRHSSQRCDMSAIVEDTEKLRSFVSKFVKNLRNRSKRHCVWKHLLRLIFGTIRWLP